ncbi:hypothetical protein [Amphibacillus jilinensis]|uniref:hypothetical protein n=1 Tax=Amphibacillus jilinensis TaxID=1216008 RepID=UPI0002EB9BE8|nr:hypothetical protein [Amphibacillus jilinensis]
MLENEVRELFLDLIKRYVKKHENFDNYKKFQRKHNQIYVCSSILSVVLLALAIIFNLELLGFLFFLLILLIIHLHVRKHKKIYDSYFFSFKDKKEIYHQFRCLIKQKKLTIEQINELYSIFEKEANKIRKKHAQTRILLGGLLFVVWNEFVKFIFVKPELRLFDLIMLISFALVIAFIVMNIQKYLDYIFKNTNLKFDTNKKLLYYFTEYRIEELGN